jgi:hypothetical protein
MRSITALAVMRQTASSWAASRRQHDEVGFVAEIGHNSLSVTA